MDPAFDPAEFDVGVPEVNPGLPFVGIPVGIIPVFPEIVFISRIGS